MDRRLLVLAPQHRRRRRPRINLLQRRREFVELAGVGGAEQRLVDHRDFLDAAQRCARTESRAFAELAVPAALGLVGQGIEPPGDIGRRGRRLLRIAENVAVEHAENRGLLDDLAIIAAVQSVQHIADGAGLLDQLAQIVAGAHLAGRQSQRRVLEAGVDQIILQRVARP